MPIKEEYTVNEVAAIFQTNPETVRKWVKEGKLHAVQGNSKKEGMRIDEPSLESFLVDNPKYTQSAYITAMLALLTGGISIPASIILRAQRQAQEQLEAEKEFVANSRIKTSDIIRLLKEEISQEEAAIAEKEIVLKSLEAEINNKYERIANIKQMIDDLNNDNRTESKNENKKRGLTVGGVSGSKKMRLGRVHTKKPNSSTEA